jgi:hypothetical protein
MSLSEVVMLRAILIAVFIFNIVFAQATVAFLIGEVEYRRNRTSPWQKAKLGQVVTENAWFKAGPQSRCEVRMPDDSFVKILENSELQITELNEKTQDFGFFSSLGNIFFSFKKILTRSVVVESPSAVVAVRGTEFLAHFSKEQSHLFVNKGIVTFSGTSGGSLVIVYGGQASKIGADGLPEQPQPLSQTQKDLMAKLASPPPAPQPNEIKKGPGKIKESEQPSPKSSGGSIELPMQPEIPVEEADDAAASKEKEKEKTTSGSKTRFRTGINIGAVTIDGKLYNQIGLRPDVSFGKFGIGLDLTLFMDEQGKIREDNWNSPDDIFEKIYYVRWAQKGDPFYLRVGAIDHYRLGYGILMNKYNNTVEYPDVIRTGMIIGGHGEKWGLDLFINNFKEVVKGDGLYAGRVYVKPAGGLEIGGSLVLDVNQYAGLEDQDDDGVPDLLDDFPNDKTYDVDTDGDGVPDEIDPDRDGDGYTDNSQIPGIDNNDPDGTLLKPDPFNLRNAGNKSAGALAFDIAIPIVNTQWLKLVTYAQYAHIFDAGWGVTAPAFRGKLFFLDVFAECRIFGKRFLPEYYNTTYELDRSFIINNNGLLTPGTKKETLGAIKDGSNGYAAGVGFDLFDLLYLSSEYQDMVSGNSDWKTFRANLSANTDFIPKIRTAQAYFYQQNADKLFRKTQGTILGYRLGYEISQSAVLLFEYRQTYQDLDGNGKIEGDTETFETTNISTVIRF